MKSSTNSIKYVWLCMYGYVCMAMYVWLCMYGYLCIAMYVWLCMYGYLCIAMYVWLCMYGYACGSQLNDCDEQQLFQEKWRILRAEDPSMA